MIMFSLPVPVRPSSEDLSCRVPPMTESEAYDLLSEYLHDQVLSFQDDPSLFEAEDLRLQAAIRIASSVLHDKLYYKPVVRPTGRLTCDSMPPLGV